MSLIRRFVILLSLCALLAMPLGAKKLRTSVKPPRQPVDTESSPGSFMVNSGCDDCNNGYNLSQVTIFGYDKPATSRTESFFINNSTDCVLTAINLDIEYLSEDSVQLHKRFVPVKCEIPAGETRKIDIKSWDTQRAFRYVDSPATRRPATPYFVRISPVAYFLRFKEQ